jgi:hypothetical protein
MDKKPKLRALRGLILNHFITISKHPAWIFAVSLVLICLFASVAEAEKPVKLSQKQIAQLTQDGDRLADNGDFKAALEKYTEAYLGVVARIRGYEFVQHVVPNMLTREELGEEMLRLMKEEYTPDDLLLMDSSFKAFGLIPPDLDSGKLITQLLTEEVAGFYDPDSKRMVLIVENGSTADPGWFGRLLGAKPAFDKDEQKTTLAHELTHALQDQLYDLNSLEEGIQDDDDMLMAFSALVEGDATLLMFVEAGDGQDITQMDPEAIRVTFNIMSWMLPLAGGQAYRSAPPIFRDSLIFPYFQGMIFVLTLAGEGGWEAVHKAFADPPVSTEQILHPVKYTQQVDVPRRIKIPDLANQLDPSWKHLGGNCLGELQTSILLKRVPQGKRAAIGWDGDRYEVYRNDQGELGLVWASIWDSEEDAVEFAEAFRQYRALPSSEPHGTTEPDQAVDQDQPAGENRSNQAELLVEVHGDRVWIVEGFTSEMASRVAARLHDCEMSDKTFPIGRKE